MGSRERVRLLHPVENGIGLEARALWQLSI